MLADLESLEKRVTNLEKRAKGGDKESAATLRLARLALEQLNAGRPARLAKVAEEDAKAWRMLQLLTTKPALYVCNVDEASAGTGNALSDLVIAARGQGRGQGGGDLRQDRERDRPAGRRTNGPSSWRPWASPSRASTG